MTGIRDPLTYFVPEGMTVMPGQRVQVPLATRKVTGIVLRAGSPLPPGIAAEAITRVLDENLFLNTRAPGTGAVDFRVLRRAHRRGLSRHASPAC